VTGPGRSLLGSYSLTSPGVVEGVIDERWSIYFVHGGVVMAALMHAAALGLARPDLRLASTSAVFCRPVPAGPVRLDVTVLRNGRSGAQVRSSLHAGDEEPGPNAEALSVFVGERKSEASLVGPTIPAELGDSPLVGDDWARPDTGDRPDAGFFESSQWWLSPVQAADPMRRAAWFRFTEPVVDAEGRWPAPALAVPGDALGLAAVPAAASSMGVVIAPSLQIDMQIIGTTSGEWIGVDSRCHHVSGGVASGHATLWAPDGVLVATVSQTALLRPIPSSG
jgi:acyl-CoA thioesterase